MKRAAHKLCLMLLCLVASVAHAKPASPPIDFTELDKLVPNELKEKNTPGAENENEVVFVPGKDGKIGFLYGAKKIR